MKGRGATRRYDEGSREVALRRLGRALDAVRKLCPDVPVLAIQWLQLRHPTYAEQEKLMRGEWAEGQGTGWAYRLASLGETLLETGRCVFHAVRLGLSVFQARWHIRRELSALKDVRFDVVAKTWCYGAHRAADDDRDFYYGDLRHRLMARRVRMLLLCGDPNDGDVKGFAKTHVSVTGTYRLPELCLVHPLMPMWMALKQIAASFRLRWMVKRARHMLLKRTMGLASRGCLSPSTTRSGLFFWMGRAVTRTWHPRVFMTLYEGNSWEKCAWWGAKTGDPRCVTAGYQHTALRPEALSLFRPCVDIKGRSLPNVILALGERTREMMREGHEKHEASVLRFGTFRDGAQGLAAPADPLRGRVLVVPEGTRTEIATLFLFAWQCARRLPSYRFILRTHPQWPMARALSLISEDILDEPNIEISDRESILDDFARVSAVLYHGSSAVLYAVLCGLKPIYFHQDEWPEADPLFELNEWRERVGSEDEFERVLRGYGELAREDVVEQWQKAVEYVRNYVMAVDDSSIERFLGAIGLAERTRGQ